MVPRQQYKRTNIVTQNVAKPSVKHWVYTVSLITKDFRAEKIKVVTAKISGKEIESH
jgi:hypothetical protein